MLSTNGQWIGASLYLKKKTKVLHLGNGERNFDYRIGTVIIDKVDRIRDLGFLITKDLSFESHCNLIVSKAIKMVHNIFRALSTKDAMVLVKAYKTFIRPLVEYGTVVFNPHKKMTSDKIERIQSNFTRKAWIRVNGLRYDSIPSSHNRNVKLGLTSLSERRRRFDLIMVHKILFGRCGLNHNEFFTFRRSITRGGSVKLCIPQARHRSRYNFFSIRAGRSYIKLSKKLVVPASLGAFKKLLDCC